MSHTLKADILFTIMVFIHMIVVGCFALFDKMGISYNLTTNQGLILSQSIIILPVVIYLIITKTNPIRLIRFKKLDIATIFMIILLTILTMPLVNFMNLLSMLFTENRVLSISQEMASNPFLLNLLLLAVVPAISEEFVFRGVLFHTYRKSSVLYGIILSGIIFGLMHLNFNQFSYAFVLGIIFALLIEATGSIFSTMIAHFIINGYSVLILAKSQKLFGNTLESSQQLQGQLTPEYLMMIVALYGMIAVGTTALAIGVYVWIVKHCNRTNHMRAVFMIRKGEDKFKIKKAFSIPLAVSIAVCLLYMIAVEVIPNYANKESQTEQKIENVDENTLVIDL